jgi:hypothetical protein
MPSFHYFGDDARVYPETGLVVEPGCDDVNSDTNPDETRFTEVPAVTPKPRAAP